MCFPCCWARSSVAKPCRRLESPATLHLVLLARQVARPCNRNDILDAFAGWRIEERRTTSNLYTPFFPRNSQNYQEKYPKGTRFSCLPWGFQHEGLSLRHNQTQSYTITCADHMISQKDTFSSCLFSILSTFMFPFSAQTGDFNGEFILINRMVDLQNPREHRHPPRERSPVHMTWRNSPPWRLIVGPLFS